VDDLTVRKRMLERGIEIGGGFGPLKGKAWRVGLMGVNATDAVVDRLLDELGAVLKS
jgi:alanine-glyoxylate transaminase/serine-glyoxylate transaminase/serine-pyruvate transaminase